jgi:hypothetical protein
VIFYIDALGLLIGRSSIWGVWLLEVFSLLGATYLGFRLLRSIFGLPVAVWTSILWLISLVPVIGSGNLTEEYAIPLQFLCLFLLHRWHHKQDSLWRPVLIGIAASGLFFLRPNLVGTPLAILLYAVGSLLLYRKTQFTRFLVAFLSGSFVAAVIPIIYFAWHHALASFLDCTFAYNIAYSHSPASHKIDALLSGLAQLPFISSISVLAWGMIVATKGTKRLPPAFSSPVVMVCMLSLPLEFCASSASGRVYTHYYMPWLPPMAVLSGLCASMFITWFKGLRDQSATGAGSSRPSAAAIGLLAILPLIPICDPFLLSSYATAAELLHHRPDTSSLPTRSVAKIVDKYTDKDDEVLVVGSNYSVINFLAHRRSPTRFSYQLPLYDGAVRPQYVHEFLQDIKTNTPALVVVSAERSMEYNRYWPTPGMNNVRSLIASNYHLIRTVADGDLQWKIYLLNKS